MPLAIFTGWFVALFLDVATVEHLNAPQTFKGYMVLLLGFLGPFALQISAYANPALFVVALYVRLRWQNLSAKKLKLAAAFIALCIVNALFWTHIPDDSGSNSITDYGPGYYLWLAVMAAAAAWLFALMRRASRRTQA